MRIEADILNVARRQPDRPAVEADGVALTFGDLEAISRQWADRLNRAGLGEGEPIWLFLPNGPEFILAVLAVLRAGCVVVPVNSRLTNHEVKHLAASCPPAAVWCSGPVSRIKEVFESEDHPGLISTTPGGGLVVEPSLAPRVVMAGRRLRASRGLPGVVYFTSGSTGRPKAILLTHVNIASNARATAEAFGLRSEDRSVVCMQMCHSYTLTKQMLAHLGVGATLVLVPDFFNPVVVLDVVDRRRATTLCAVPSMHVMMHEHIRRRLLSLPTLRLLTTGGSPMPDRVQVGLCELLPHVAFISSYGLSEASPCVTALESAWAVPKVGSIGWAIPGVRVRIAGDEGRETTVGEVGELCVRGPNVMAGYLNDPAATARALRGGWLHTGDLGWLDSDGCVYLCGRRDDLILRGGENIYPAEVENVLCDHPAILEAAVVGVSHPVLGQDVAAFVTLRDPGRLDLDLVREHCRRQLALFKVPREIHVVEALPRTPNGKIHRSALRGTDGQAATGSCAAAKEPS